MTPYHEHMGTRPKRSTAMLRVLARLEEKKRSRAWLGRHLTPPVTRQTVAGYPDIPDHYIAQVAKLLDLMPCQIRPDLAKLFHKPETGRSVHHEACS